MGLSAPFDTVASRLLVMLSLPRREISKRPICTKNGHEADNKSQVMIKSLLREVSRRSFRLKSEDVMDDLMNCSVCQGSLEESFGSGPEFIRMYPHLVCRRCDERAVNKDGQKPFHDPMDFGDNPVFIDGIKCWRRYKFGGFVTMRDMFDCSTLREFNERRAHEVKLRLRHEPQ
jgi:hypothetical protein